MSNLSSQITLKGAPPFNCESFNDSLVIELLFSSYRFGSFRKQKFFAFHFSLVFGTRAIDEFGKMFSISQLLGLLTMIRKDWRLYLEVVNLVRCYQRNLRRRQRACSTKKRDR